MVRVRAKNKAQPLCVPSPEGVGQPQPTSAMPSAKRTLREDSSVQSSVLEEGVPPSAPGAEPPSSSLPLTNKRPLSTAGEGEGDKVQPTSDAEISNRVLDELRDEYRTVLGDIEAVVEGNFSARLRPSCQGIRVDGALLRAVDDLIAQEWEDCSGKTLWKLNCLVYAGTVVVERVVKRSLVRPGGGGCPRVESIRRKEAEVTELRWKIGWLKSEISRRKTYPKMTERQYRKQARICRIFGPQSLRELEAQLETLKGFLCVHCLQLRRLKKTLRRKKLNEQYRRLGPSLKEAKRGFLEHLSSTFR